MSYYLDYKYNIVISEDVKFFFLYFSFIWHFAVTSKRK